MSRLILGFGPRFAGAGFSALPAAGLALGLGPLLAGAAFAAGLVFVAGFALGAGFTFSTFSFATFSLTGGFTFALTFVFGLFFTPGLRPLLEVVVGAAVANGAIEPLNQLLTSSQWTLRFVPK